MALLSLEIASDGYLTPESSQPLLIAQSGYLGGATALIVTLVRLFASINTGETPASINTGETPASINED